MELENSSKFVNPPFIQSPKKKSFVPFRQAPCLFLLVRIKVIASFHHFFFMLRPAFFLTTQKGNRFNCFYGSPLGSSQQPISEEIFFNKFKSCLQYSDKFFNTEKLFQQLKTIERLGDNKELFA